jgi:hypothetical protein
MKKTLLALAALLASTATARAAPPATLTYSGFLSDAAGNPVTTATTLTFRLYAAATGGAPLFQEAIAVVPGSDGYFSAVVGAGATVVPLAEFDAPRFMSVQYGSEAEMAPRIALTSVPSAFSALTVDWAGVTGRPVSTCGGTTPYVTGLDVNGNVTCAAAPAGGAGCATGEVLKWNGAAWACSAAGTGTISSVVAGTGITTSTVGGAVTVAADSTSVQTRVSGQCGAGNAVRVVNQDGTVVCQAVGTGTVTSVGATTGGGVAVAGSASAPTVGLQSCASDAQVLRWNAAGGTWSCANAYTVLVNGPLSASSTATTATVSLGRASASADGYLAGADFATFAGKQTAIGAGCGAGNAMRGVDPTTGVVSCVPFGLGTITGVSAGSGLTGGGSSGSVSLAVSFGGNGAAASAARSDHSHRINIPIDSFRASYLTPTLTTVALGPAVVPSFQMSGVQGIGFAVMVPTAPSSPQVRWTIYNPGATAAALSLSVSATGIATGAATPTCQWGGAGYPTPTVPAGQTATVTVTIPTASTNVCNTNAPIAAGDMLWIGLSGQVAGNPTFHVMGADIIF